MKNSVQFALYCPGFSPESPTSWETTQSPANWDSGSPQLWPCPHPPRKASVPLPGLSQWLFLYGPHPVCSVNAGGIRAVPQIMFCPMSFVVTSMRCHTNLTLVSINRPMVKLVFLYVGSL